MRLFDPDDIVACNAAIYAPAERGPTLRYAIIRHYIPAPVCTPGNRRSEVVGQASTLDGVRSWIVERIASSWRHGNRIDVSEFEAFDRWDLAA